MATKRPTHLTHGLLASGNGSSSPQHCFPRRNWESAGPGFLEPFCVVRSIELTQKRRVRQHGFQVCLCHLSAVRPWASYTLLEPRFLHLYNGDDSHIKHVSVFTPMTAESLKYLTQRYCILRKMKSNCFRGFSSRVTTQA